MAVNRVYGGNKIDSLARVRKLTLAVTSVGGMVVGSTALFVGQVARAATYSYTNAVADNSWSLNTNWSPSTPVGGVDRPGDIAVIATSVAANIYQSGDPGDAVKSLAALIMSGNAQLNSGSGAGSLDFNNRGLNATVRYTGGGGGTIAAPISLNNIPFLEVANVFGASPSSNPRLFLSGTISGTGGLIIQGNGVVNLGGLTNNFSGDVILNSGILVTGAAGGATGTYFGTGTLIINGGALSSGQAGTSGTWSGNNVQNWNGDFAIAGAGVTINAGTGNVNLGGSRTVTFTSTGTFNVNGAISDGGSGYDLTVQGSGSGGLSLGGANSYSGTTTVNSATLTGTQLGGTPFGTGNMAINGGVLRLIPVTGSATVTGVNATAGSTFTYAGGTQLVLTRNGSNSLGYTIGNASPTGAVLVRTSGGTMVIAPTSTALLGSSEKFIVNGLTASANKNGVANNAGIYDASIVDQTGSGNTGLGSFVKYDASSGFLDAASGSSVYTTAVTGTTIAANTISNVTGSISINNASNPYAMRMGAVTLTNSGTTTVNGGASSSTNSGLGGVILNPTATASVITGGTLAFGSSEGTIYVGGGAGGGSISSIITGTAGLTKFGPGTLTVNAANSYTGTTNVNQGTLAYGASDQILSGPLTVNGTSATVSLGAFSDTVGTITVANAGNITGTGTLTTTGTLEMQAGSVSAVLAGSGALNKTTSGSMTLSGLNLYTGGTNLNSGVLILNVNRTITGDPLGGTGGTATNPNTSTMGVIRFNGGTLQFTGNNVIDYSSKFSTAANQSFRFDTNAQNVTFGTKLSSTNGTLTKLGTGTLTLNSSASDYNGLTTVLAGTLKEGANNAIGTGGVTVDGASAFFDVDTRTDSVGTVTVANGGSLIGTTGVLTSTGSFEMKSGFVTAILAGNVALNKTTGGTVSLTSASTHSGGTAISAGRLIVNGGKLGSGNVTVATGAVLELDAVTDSFAIADSATLNIAARNGTGNDLVALNFSGLEYVNTLILGSTTYTSGLFSASNGYSAFFDSNFNGAIMVPEPTGLSLAWLAGLVLLHRRRGNGLNTSVSNQR